MAIEQIQLCVGDRTWVPGQDVLEALRKLARVIRCEGAIAMAAGERSCVVVYVNKETGTRMQELVIHDRVGLIADEPAVGALPDFANNVGVGIFRLDAAAKCAPEVVVVKVP